MEATRCQPWIEHCLESFGVDRCMFASNFPVDAMHGTFDELYGGFDRVTADLGADARDKLFAANAERLYAAEAPRRESRPVSVMKSVP